MSQTRIEGEGGILGEKIFPLLTLLLSNYQLYFPKFHVYECKWGYNKLSIFDVVENGRRPNKGVDGVVVRIMS